MAVQPATVAMTTEELERTMRTLEPIYDLVRVVDPNRMEGSSLREDGELDLPHRCYDLLDKGRRCQNCISARTVSCKHSVSKFEFVGDAAFYISTRYVEVDGQPRSIELVKQINEETLTPPANEDAAQEMRSIMEHDADHRYRDDMTDALGPRYLEDGIADLVVSRLAMVRVRGLATPLPGRRDDPRTGVAHAIDEAIRPEDTLVRYDQNTFVIIFEGIARARLEAMLDRVRGNVRNVLGLVAPTGDADVAIGAVLREGTVRALMEDALLDLDKARQSGQPTVITASSKQANASKPAAVVSPPTPGVRTSEVDALTRLLAPHVFRDRLQELIEEQPAPNEGLCVVHADVENFKAFNRTYGMSEGDVLLTRLAKGLRDEFTCDLATRTGIDTFAVATTKGDVLDRISRLHDLLDALRRDAPLELKAGICAVHDDTIDALAAMDRAKIACDSIKGKYSRSVRMFDDRMDHEVNMRDHLVESLDDAIARGYLRPYYQGIVRSFTTKACSVEVLSRWIDPEYGLISPAEVIPTLERHHLIHKHDAHIVRCACRDLRDRMDRGLDCVPISVNLSRLDFELCDIFAAVDASAAEFNIPRSLIGIEITESTLDQANDVFSAQVDRFRETGYEIWMDDFGSGYSSLNVLKDYRFDVLKIDMAFLHGFDENRNSRMILSVIVDMAKRIGIRTLAEGVEDEAQFEFLRSIGCEMIQGFLFSRPMPADQLSFDHLAGVEDEDERAYYDMVGRVNLLSQQPVGAIRPQDAALSSGMPFAIVEWDGNTLRYLTTNDAYLKHLRSAGLASVGDAERTLAQNADVRAWFSAQRLDEDAAERDHVLCYDSAYGRRCMTVRHIACRGAATAYLISPHAT